ncbi:hypothetical protein OKW21_001666 [Catalinimonas alkaloidigena]|nr:hypothetical protein [Catalinimonas alkaloidigena]
MKEWIILSINNKIILFTQIISLCLVYSQSLESILGNILYDNAIPFGAHKSKPGAAIFKGHSCLR